MGKKSCGESEEPLSLGDGVLPLTSLPVLLNQNPAFTELFGTRASLTFSTTFLRRFFPAILSTFAPLTAPWSPKVCTTMLGTWRQNGLLTFQFTIVLESALYKIITCMCDLRGHFKDLLWLRDRMCEKSKSSFVCTFRGIRNIGCQVDNL